LLRVSSILWLASYPKSGNTWVRAFLANLVADRDTALPLSELPRYCVDEAQPELYTAIAGRPSDELTIDEICALRRQVHANIAGSRNGTVFVKTHNLAGSFNGQPLHSPDHTAGAVVVIRNPLDVAVSMTYHFGLTTDEAIERLAAENLATGNDRLFVSQILGSWSTHVASWHALAGPRVLVLRYEDMIAQPTKSFVKVARLVGLGSDRRRVERAIHHASFQKLAAAEKRDGFAEVSDKTRRFFRVGRANQWREVLSRPQVQRVISTHRIQMDRFRYLPAGY